MAYIYHQFSKFNSYFIAFKIVQHVNQRGLQINAQFCCGCVRLKSFPHKFIACSLRQCFGLFPTPATVLVLFLILDWTSVDDSPLMEFLFCLKLSCGGNIVNSHDLKFWPVVYVPVLLVLLEAQSWGLEGPQLRGGRKAFLC